MKLSLNKLNLSLGMQLEQEARRGIGISHFFGKNEWLYRIEKWINGVNQGYRGNFKGFVVLTSLLPEDVFKGLGMPGKSSKQFQ